MRTRTVELGGYRIAVSRQGTGRPVLLINGLGANMAMWRSLIGDLGGLHTICFDAPGTGKSSTPLHPYSVRMLAEMLVDLLDRLDIEQVDVVGYSFGGAVAQQLAHDHPERVRRLVLGATTFGWGGIPGDVLSFMSLATPLRYYSKLAYTVSAPYLAGGSAEADPAFIKRTAGARLASPPSVLGYWLQLLAAWSWTSLPWLDTVSHPALVLTGAQDRVIPPVNSEIIASQMPNARLVEIAGWGHYLLLDGSSGAGAAIGEFLRSEDLRDSETWASARRVSPGDAARSARAQRGLLTALAWPHTLFRWGLLRG